MAKEKNLELFTVPAGGDLSSNQFLAHTLSSGRAVLQTTVGGWTLGPLQNNPGATGRAASFPKVGSIAKGMAGDTITALAKVTPEATTGRFKVATTAEEVYGVAMEAAADGQIFEIMVTQEGIL